MKGNQERILNKIKALKAELNVESEKAKKIIAKKIKTRRKKLGLTQTKVAAMMGTERNTYTMMETGNTWVQAKYMVRLCQILEMTPNELLDF